MEDKDIKEKINKVIEKSYDLNVYVKILEDFFTYEIETPSKTIMSLNILPNLNHKQIEQNIKKNIGNITSYIKNQSNLSKRPIKFYHAFMALFWVMHWVHFASFKSHLQIITNTY
jgi:hypothetical protein